MFGAREADILEDTGLELKRFLCFILPAGYRVARDVAFWDTRKHGAYGKMEHILAGYNRHVVPRFGKEEASKPEEMVTLEGEPMNIL